MFNVSKYLLCLQLLMQLRPQLPCQNHCTVAAVFLRVCSNCLNIFPTGHWPLTGHRITKSCLTGSLLPAKHDWLCWGHLWCTVLAYNRWIKSIKYAAAWKQSLWFFVCVLLAKLCPCRALCLLYSPEMTPLLRLTVPKANPFKLLLICLRQEGWYLDKRRQSSYQASQWSSSFDRCCYPKWIW